MIMPTITKRHHYVREGRWTSKAFTSVNHYHLYQRIFMEKNDFLKRSFIFAN